MSSATSSRAFRIALGILALTTIAPIPLGGWLDGLVLQLVTPVSEPLARLTHVVRTPPSPLNDDHPDVSRLKLELMQARTEMRRLEGIVSNLRRQLREYEEQAAEGVRLLRARRAGSPAAGRSRSFRINAGRRQGVEYGVAATYAGYQLVGRVTEIDLLTSVVTPITEGGAPSVLEVVILHEGATMETGPDAALEPVGDGSLRGLIDRSLPVEVGDEVRLDDASWGDINIGLLVGKITEIRPHDDPPLFNEIIVRPDEPIDRVDSVMLRIPEMSDERPEGRRG